VKVLVATPDDGVGTVAGELVRLPIARPGHPSGAARPGFVGMSSHAVTPTVTVDQRPGLDERVLATLFEEDCRDRGLALGDDLRQGIGIEVQRLARVADAFPVGTVLERHGVGVRARS
jgi:hypothetical protein